MSERWLTMREAVHRLRLPRHRILQLARQGKLPVSGGEGPRRRVFFPADRVRALRERSLKRYLGLLER